MTRLVTLAALLVGLNSPALAMSPGDRTRDVGRAGPVGPVGAAVAARETRPPLGSDTSPLQWGVQFAGSFSRQQALASFARIQARYPEIIGDQSPVVIGTPLGNRGPGPLYRVRLPAPSRAAAVELCGRIHSAGGSCVVLPAEW